jgi:prepilin-type N-terminal cleavage/methylation domain-containing protein
MRERRQNSLLARTGGRRPFKRSGFSLIELMVALAILAAVTTVALRSVSKLQDQARYTNTTGSLNNIQAAIIGPANQHWPDGSPQVTGFVADIGRLPNFLISGSDPLGANGDPFNELLQPNSIPVYSFLTSASDPSIKIGVGWQGPYLRLGAGPTYIRDGWGNSFLAYDNSGNPATTGNPIYQIASAGTNTAPYNIPVSVPSPTIVSGGGFVPTATLTGRITMNLATDLVGPNNGNQSGPAPNITYTPASGSPVSQAVSIWVCYFGPQVVGGVASVVEVPVEVYSTTPPIATTTWSFAVSGTIGPRVLRAYVLPSTVVTFNAAAVSSAYLISAPLTITATGGAQTLPNIVLPHYSP